MTLFPKETCQCPSTTTCCSYSCCKDEYRSGTNWKENVVNLRLLTKNSRKKVDKKSGKKQPRPFDYEIEPIVEPAPDSVYLGNTPKTPKTPASVIKNIKTPTPTQPQKHLFQKRNCSLTLNQYMNIGHLQTLSCQT